MNDQLFAIVIALIVATPGTLTAVAALWVNKKTHNEAKKAHEATKETHRLVNSRMDELLRLTRIEATDDERERVKLENAK